MDHRKLSNIAKTLEIVKTDMIYAIQMIDDEKRHPVIMQQISQIHSKLIHVEQMILEDFTENDLLRIR